MMARPAIVPYDTTLLRVPTLNRVLGTASVYSVLLVLLVARFALLTRPVAAVTTIRRRQPMLKQLRAEALALIATTPHCILSTIGPAGLQASVVTCVVQVGCVYVLVPSTVDHLFNIEHELEVVLTSTLWQLRGVALALGEGAQPRGTAPDPLQMRGRAAGMTLVEVFPLRMHIEAAGSRRYRETIDFDVPA